MKKLILFIILTLSFVACNGHYERVQQTGTVIDVEYHPAHTTMTIVPVRVGKVTTSRVQPVHHDEYWYAHIHYCDTICVHEIFYEPVESGNIVTRNVRIFVKDKN